MGKEGYLTIHTFEGDNFAPVSGVRVIVLCEYGNTVSESHTDQNGLSIIITLPASADFDNLKRYTVKLSHSDGFRDHVIQGITIFPGITSNLPVQMLPNSGQDHESGGGREQEKTIIPPQRGVDERSAREEVHLNPFAIFIFSLFRVGRF